MDRKIPAWAGTRVKPIAGYPGTQEIMLAIELDGIVGYSWGAARAGNRDDLASGRLKIVMRLGLQKHKELPDVPMLDEFVTKQQDRLVLDMIFRGKRWAVPNSAAWPLSTLGDSVTKDVCRGDARPAAYRRGRQDGP